MTSDPDPKCENNAWAVTLEDVSAAMAEGHPASEAYVREAFAALSGPDVSRITRATLDCVNFEHQAAMADHMLSFILFEKGFIARAAPRGVRTGRLPVRD